MQLSRAFQGHTSVWTISFYLDWVPVLFKARLIWTLEWVRLFSTPRSWLCGRLQDSYGTEKWLHLKADQMSAWSTCANLNWCVYIHMYQILISKIRQSSRIDNWTIGLSSVFPSAVIIMHVSELSFQFIRLSLIALVWIQMKFLERNRVQRAYGYHHTTHFMSHQNAHLVSLGNKI